MYNSYYYNQMRNNFRQNGNLNNDFSLSSYFFDNNMMDNSMMNTPNNSNNDNMILSDPKTGYSRGNLFSNLYSEYKNYTPRKLSSNDPKTKLWLELSETFFAAHEINLYLDINPDDDSMIQLFNDYRRKANMLKEEYESKYGPICTSSDMMNSSPFPWVNASFPWEGGIR